MSKDEIKYENNKMPDRFSGKSLEDLLAFLKDVDDRHPVAIFNSGTLQKILFEDKDLLQKLAR